MCLLNIARSQLLFCSLKPRRRPYSPAARPPACTHPPAHSAHCTALRRAHPRQANHPHPLPPVAAVDQPSTAANAGPQPDPSNQRANIPSLPTGTPRHARCCWSPLQRPPVPQTRCIVFLIWRPLGSLRQDLRRGRCQLADRHTQLPLPLRRPRFIGRRISWNSALDSHALFFPFCLTLPAFNKPGARAASPRRRPPPPLLLASRPTPSTHTVPGTTASHEVRDPVVLYLTCSPPHRRPLLSCRETSIRTPPPAPPTEEFPDRCERSAAAAAALCPRCSEHANTRTLSHSHTLFSPSLSLTRPHTRPPSHAPPPPPLLPAISYPTLPTPPLPSSASSPRRI